MKKAFINLHKSGYAHSVECWHNKELVGGLYGIAMGKIFFGESMFSRMSNTSKITLVHLAKRLEEMNFQLIDCQINSKHLQTLGAQLITRNQFTKFLKDFCNFKKILLH
jgi:leucyl/phenylalanyl-tRNA--protein transferase